MAAEAGAGPADFVIPDTLPVLPLRDAVVLPLTAVPLTVGRPRSVQLVDDVMRGNRLLALVAEREAKSDPGPEDLHRVGTVGAIHQLHRVPDGTVRLMVQGIERIRLVDFTGTDPYLVARVEVLKDQTDQATEVEALRRAVVDVFRRLVEASAEMPDEMATAAENLSDPRHVAYFVAAVVPIDVAARQELLELDPVSAKLRRLIDLLQRELAVRELGRKITTETEERLTKKQREYYLREQLRSIQKELGDEQERGSEGAELRRRIEEAGLPDEARREAERELTRLAGLSPASPEHGMIVTYLEWMASLPWNKLGGGAIDIRRARQILDEDHFDLEKVKDRILEYLAVKKLRQDRVERAVPADPGEQRRARRAAACHRRQSGAGADPVLRGAAGRGQDQPRPEHCPGPGPAVLAHVAGRGARRGGDPGASEDLYRRLAGPHHPGAAARRDARPRLHARRDRQDRLRLAWRSVVGPARGARSGAESHVCRQLPRSTL